MLRLPGVQDGFQGGKSAGAVILAVGGHQAAVPAQIPRRAGGDHLHFGAHQVLFFNAVGVLQVLEEVEFEALLGVLVPQGQ